MINMTQFIQNEKRDNIVVVNNAQFRVTDEVAMKIMALIQGEDIPVSQPTQTAPVVDTKADKESKPAVVKGLKDIQYHIKKQTSADGKTLFCISRGTPTTSKNGKEYLKNGGYTSAEKACINNAIKSLDGITTIKVKVDFSFDAWGYKTKKEAEAKMATLPTSFSAEEVAKFQRTKRA